MTTPDRIKQVTTTKEKYGEDHFRKIGSAGGKKSTGKFNSDTARKAVQSRWDKHRAEQAKRQGKEQENG